MDAPTEYYKKDFRDRLKILKNDFKFLSINLLLLFFIYYIDKLRNLNFNHNLNKIIKRNQN